VGQVRFCEDVPPSVPSFPLAPCGRGVRGDWPRSNNLSRPIVSRPVTGQNGVEQEAAELTELDSEFLASVASVTSCSNSVVPCPVPSFRGLGHQFCGSPSYRKKVTRPLAKVPRGSAPAGWPRLPSLEFVPSGLYPRPSASDGRGQGEGRVVSRPVRPVRKVSGPDSDRPQSARRRLPGILSPSNEKGSPPPAGILFSSPPGIISPARRGHSHRGPLPLPRPSASDG